MKCSSNKMLLVEIIEFINEIELQFPVDTWIINGIEIWPLIRVQIVAYYLRNSSDSSNNKYFKSKNFEKISMVLKEIYIYLKINILDKKHNVYDNDVFEVLISGYNGDRTIQLSNMEKFDVNCDPFYHILYNDYGIRSIFFERYSTNNKNLNLPRYSYTKIINLWILKHTILANMESRKIKNRDFKLDYYHAFKEYMEKCKFPINLISENSLYKNTLFYKNFSQDLAEYLKRRKIKLVLMMCYYSSINFALAIACKQLNIPCIDIQHGCAGESFHEMYYSWKNIPVNGYKLLPTGFWCWSKEDAEAIANWNYKGAKPDIFIGGRLIRELWSNKEGKLYAYYLDKLENNIKKCKFKKIILFTLQPGILYNEYLRDAIEKSNDYLWIIRSHFTIDDLQERFMKSFDGKGNVLLTKSVDYPLEFLLTYIDLHITYSSSVIIDAEYFSKVSIMLDRDSINRYKKYFELGCLEFADGADELLSKIEVLSERKYERSKDVFIDGYQEIDRLVRVIKKEEQ